MINKIQNLHTTIKPYLRLNEKTTTAIPYIDIYCYCQKELILPDTANPYMIIQEYYCIKNTFLLARFSKKIAQFF